MRVRSRGPRPRWTPPRGVTSPPRRSSAIPRFAAPFSGVVADRPLYAGEMASAGTPLVTVVDISRVVARANVPLDQAGYVKVGDPATVSLSDGSPPVPGKVTVVQPRRGPGQHHGAGLGGGG